MALQNVKADGNVPFIGPRGRFRVLNLTSTWLVQEGTLDGKRPRTASLTADELDPVVTAGRAEWKSLTEGGLFDLAGNHKEAVVLEAMQIDGVTVSIVALDGTTVLRPGPVNDNSFPFKMAPGEMIRVSGGAFARFLARIDAQRIL